LAVVLALIVFVPWWKPGHEVVIGKWLGNPPMPTSLGSVRTDWSYILALPEIQRQHLQWGTETLFTYGPLGFFHTAYVPSRLIALVLVVRVALAVVFALACHRLLAKARVRSRWAVIVLWIALVIVWFDLAEGRHEIYWLSFPILLVVFDVLDRDDRLRPTGLLIALAACTGFVSLVKFSFFTVAAVCVVAILCNDLARRRWSWTAFVAIASAAVLWVAADQSLRTFPHWFAASVELSTTYSDAMAKGFLAPYSYSDLALFGIAAIVPLVAYAVVPTRPRRGQFLLISVLLLVTFIQSKHAFGGNQLEDATSTLAFLIVVYAALIPFGTLSPRRAAIAVGALAAGAVSSGAILIQHDSWDGTLATRPWDAAAYVADKTVAARDRLRAGGQGTEAFQARIRALAALPPLKGTLDAFPDYAGVAVSLAGVTYHPRPMFLSINSQTPRMIRANADFYRGADAPGTVLFNLFVYPALPWDRFPASVDGQSWLQFLSHYDVTDQTDDFVVLKRGRDIAYRLDPISTLHIRPGERVSVPTRSGLLWATLDIRRSIVGSLVNAIYKSPPTWVSVRSAGTTSSFRLVPEMAREGFLLSPLTTTNDDFVLLSQVRRGHDLGNEIGRVSSFVVDSSPHLPALLASTMTLRLYRLHLTTTRSALPPYATRLLAAYDVRRHVRKALFPPQLIREGGLPAVLAHAPSETVVPVPIHATNVRIRYGLDPSAWQAPGANGDGAVFTITALRASGGKKVLWERLVDPRNGQDRRMFTVAIRLPPRTGRLVLRTLPGPRSDPSFDHTYWAGITWGSGRYSRRS
jgi:hypothetical protein